ncbi:hypothetical protein Asphe3_29800 [Pseudarthrobacter phenanthrenivorans Sphe3]|uniref:Uncharacterized protein n=1 Tax=Pseudarthrobacter phenanthrenivorans (strain DSM 18606 / JCM 16027 / LMG 23796 / Sphe3) TaxID=930171 RepID=F0MBV1_PSEPM|nr:hypothetical protein [Pseudarthrobacter phenanthrenivorans]ADX74092.1 hypothetical protein Asphe3_29800 [Pseudarthrobacter phenanthrenivorans Sphe3]
MAKIAGRKKRIIGTTAALIAIGGGAAFAYWSATGTGSTTAAAGTSKSFTIEKTAVEGEALSPGGPSQTFTFKVTNPAGAGVQKVSNVAVEVANSDGTAWSLAAGCSKDDFLVGTPTFTAAELAPGETATGTVTLQMLNLAGVSQDGCKNAQVPLYFSAN